MVIKRKDQRSSASADERELGMDTIITRRDFMNSALVGSGAALMVASCDQGGENPEDSAPVVGPKIDPETEAAFDGFGGIGDYSTANGNTWRVVSAAHQIRDGVYSDDLFGRAADTGEDPDLVIVGAGAGGLGAAQYYLSKHGRSGRCIVIDNHSVPGGEAKRNEFMVNGQHLIAAQGSNALFAPAEKSVEGQKDDFLYSIFNEIGFPLNYKYAPLTGTTKNLEFDSSNFFYMFGRDHSDSIGFFFDDDQFGHGRTWVRNPWKNGLAGAGLPEALRREMLRWRYDLYVDRPNDRKFDQWLDSITYRQLLVDTHGLPVAVADFTEPLIASATGMGASAVSAYCATKRLGLPGIGRPGETRTYPGMEDTSYFEGTVQALCFPGGNTAVARAFIKSICPTGISGGNSMNDIVTGRFNFAELDKSGAPVRIRLSSTVVDVRHVPSAGRGEKVRITYEKGGRLYSLFANKVVMANGGWVNKHIVADLPDKIKDAYGQFHYSAVVSANVALTNWKFLERLGITACVYTGGDFGFSCNIRRPMVFPSYAPPLDPGKPSVLTFYASYVSPGEDVATQGAASRMEIISTPFREFERRIRSQMVRLFGHSGLDPARDIAGITINRWGHAYVVPEPGFFFGRGDQPSPLEAVKAGHGKIAFGAAELRGYQNYRGAVYEARRALDQVSNS